MELPFTRFGIVLVLIATFQSVRLVEAWISRRHVAYLKFTGFPRRAPSPWVRFYYLYDRFSALIYLVEALRHLGEASSRLLSMGMLSLLPLAFLLKIWSISASGPFWNQEGIVLEEQVGSNRLKKLFYREHFARLMEHLALCLAVSAGFGAIFSILVLSVSFLVIRRSQSSPAYGVKAI